MSMLQKVGCCSCSVPELPCNDCNTDRCTCGPSEAQPQTVPVTSVHINISEMSTSSFRNGIRNKTAWHYGPNKNWRSTEFGVRGRDVFGQITRLALRATPYALGYRFRDHMSLQYITSRLQQLTIPSGRWGEIPSRGLNTLKAVCGPCDNKSTGTFPCGDDMVICCRCSEPGSVHDCFITSTFDCLASGGNPQGTYSGGSTNPACAACTDSCNGWTSGIVGVVQRSYNLIKDAFFRGYGNLYRNTFNKEFYGEKDAVKRREKHRRRTLTSTAIETSDHPQIFPEEQTLTIAKSEGALERAESRVVVPITTKVEHESQFLDLNGGRMARGIGGGIPDDGDCPGDPCITGTICGPNCYCVAGSCQPIPQPVNCPEHCGAINDCTERGEWWQEFGKDLDQSDEGVWNYNEPYNDCCGASYAGTSITVEMDWPCEETANAYIKARQKFEFGQAAFKEAQRYCREEGQGTLDCGNAPDTVKPECCNPLAQELIGAMPPTTIPCIKHCPLQGTTGGACPDDYVRWPQGDKQPDGENVLQSVSCMGGATVEGTFDPEEDYNSGIEGPDDVSPAIVTPTGNSPCTFKTNPVSRNYAAFCNGGHQCGEGSYCGSQFCCHEIDCYNTNCCEQIFDYNPNTGEPTTDEQRLYLGPAPGQLCPYGLADDGNGNLGGWSAIPDADGIYHRCKRPQADCDYIVGDEVVTLKGCELVPEGTPRVTSPNCPQGQNVPPCCSGGDFTSPSGDVISWIIPRRQYAGAPQGIYGRHCPDTIEPFVPRGGSKYINPNCRRELAPIPGDPGWCPWESYNPTGTVCTGGLCVELNTPSDEEGNGNWGDPYHTWENQPYPDGSINQCGVNKWQPCVKKPTAFSSSDPCTPIAWETNEDVGHDPAACGATPCDDILTPDGKCVRCEFKGKGKTVRLGSRNACRLDACDGVPGVKPTLGEWSDGYFEDEIGLQIVSVSCGPLSTKPFDRGNVYTAGECDGFEERPIQGFEKGFQIALEYKGGGTSYDSASGTIGRQGTGRFVIIKDEDAPTDCIFGSYNNLLEGYWNTGGGSAGIPPYYDQNSPGDGFYYKHGLNLDENNNPECDKDIWKRAPAQPSCRWTNPRAVIL